MQQVTFYGLDQTGAVVWTEHRGGLSGPEIRELAEERLATHEAVEVWKGAKRVLSLSRKNQIVRLA